MIHLYKSLKVLLSNEDSRKVIFLSSLLFIIVVLEVAAVLIITLLVSGLNDPDQTAVQINSFVSFFTLHSPINLSFNYLLLLVIFYVIFSIFIYLHTMRYVSLQTQLITSNLKSNFISKTLSLSWMENIDQNSSQRISNVLNDTVQIGFTLIDLMYLLSRFYLSILLICWLLYVDLAITASILLTLLVLYILIHLILRPYLLKYGEQTVEFNQSLVKSLTNMFGHIKEIIFYNSQSKQKKALRDINLKIASSMGKKFFLVNIPRFLIDSLILIFIVLGVAFYSNTALVPESFYSTISIFGVAAIKMLPAIQNIFYYTQQILSRKKNLDNLVHYFQQFNPQKTRNIYTHPSSFQIQKNLSFKNINFAYKKRVSTLRDFSVSIDIGDRIAIVGPSGSGKSTFLDILLGILPPSSGEIFLDSTLSNFTNTNQYRKNFSYVPQKTFLVEGTLKENILLYGGEHVLDAAESEILAKSKISNFIHNLDNGLDTLVSETSQKISGGEKQCIGFARAFVQEKEIMVLDEATSSMDKDLSSGIMHSAFSASKTIICVSHQAHLLHLFDKIMVFENGCLIDFDTLDSLLMKNEFIKRLMQNDSKKKD